LRDPAGGQLRRGKRGTLAARRRWAGHGLVVSRRGSGRRRGGLRGTKAMAGGGRKASNGGTAGFFLERAKQRKQALLDVVEESWGGEVL
jgi:hypothetical protein